MIDYWVSLIIILLWSYSSLISYDIRLFCDAYAFLYEVLRLVVYAVSGPYQLII